MKQRNKIPGVDSKLLIKDAGKLMPDPMRRNFLRGAASLGALTFLTGETFDGTAAAAMGLVTVAVPEADLDAEVERVCAALVTGHPQGLRETKGLLGRHLVANIDANGADLAKLSARLFGSDEAREAMLAFLSRKKR